VKSVDGLSLFAAKQFLVHNQLMNSPAVQVMADDQQTQKFLTLLELSKAITSHHDLSELFHELACRLENLFPFRDMAVMLHEDHRDVMRSYIMEGCATARWVGKESTEVSIDDSINGHVWKT